MCSHVDFYMLGLGAMTTTVTSENLDLPERLNLTEFKRLSNSEVKQLVSKGFNNQIDTGLFTFKFCDNSDHFICLGNSIYFFEDLHILREGVKSKEFSLFSNLAGFSNSLFGQDDPMLDFERFAGPVIEQEWDRLQQAEKLANDWDWEAETMMAKNPFQIKHKSRTLWSTQRILLGQTHLAIHLRQTGSSPQQ